MRKTLTSIFILFALVSCGDDAVIYAEPNQETIIIAIVRENSIFIQGHESNLSQAQFKASISKLLIKNNNLNFVIQTSLGSNLSSTQFVVHTLQKLGVKSKYVAIAKQGT